MHVHSPQIHEPTTRSRTWINLYLNTWSQARVVKSCPNGLRSPPPPISTSSFSLKHMVLKSSSFQFEWVVPSSWHQRGRGQCCVPLLLIYPPLMQAEKVPRKLHRIAVTNNKKNSEEKEIIK